MICFYISIILITFIKIHQDLSKKIIAAGVDYFI